jgi:hypothetical protein
MRKKKIAFDFHGVLDTHEYIRDILYLMNKSGEYVTYIITGATLKDFEEQSIDLNLEYDVFFSIQEYLDSSNKEHISVNKHGNKIYKDEDWNKVKAMFCKINRIDVLFDDSEIYEKYFITDRDHPTKYVLVGN